jgi:elongation factor P--(R)-beta-lysine ligase
MSDWRPSASLDAIAARAKLLHQLRAFFAVRKVMEVETPLLAQATVPDPNLEVFALSADVTDASLYRFLQTSPEFAMKRLLAAGSGDIFQISKAFRKEESGRHHNPEFSLLEWYRVDWDHRMLIREVAELVCEVLGRTGWQVWTYRALFQEHLSIDLFDPNMGHRQLVDIAQQRIGDLPLGLDYDATLALLMSHCIEPAISDWGVVFVTEFPVSQAALARTMAVDSGTVAARFECYIDGREVANGYWEQCDVAGLTAQFLADNEQRQQRGLPLRELDQRLLAAQAEGLPDCAGVALGVDRLLALQIGVSTLAETLSFDWHRA